MMQTLILIVFMAFNVEAICPTEGYYVDSTATQTLANCPGYVQCEPGNFCQSLEKKPCPEGTYCSEFGCEDLESCQVCPEGYYCPEQSPNPLECGSPGFFCLERSSTPTQVAAGYYSVGGETEKTQISTLLCEPGFYCMDGVKQSCPGGKVGIESGLTTPECNQNCPPGFFCPPQSSDLYAHSCRDDVSIYCPSGSASPVEVTKGYYSVQPDIAVAPFAGAASEEPCEPGYYCPYDFSLERSTGQKIPCPGGRFGFKYMEIYAACSGICEERYFCPPGSTNSRQEPCGDDMFCPAGSSAPIDIKDGYYIPEGTTEISPQQYICPKGSYCVAGNRYDCPAGRYGEKEGLSSNECSGLCTAGYFCESGSVSPQEYDCGNGSVYCPSGSSSPTPAATGYYSIGIESTFHDLQSPLDQATRIDQTICRPGHYCIDGEIFRCAAGLYGDSFGLHSATCSGPCAAGYYCPIASVSSMQFPCGSSRFYCPEGSAKPIPTDRGFCSTGGDETTRTYQSIAPIGHYAWSGECYKCPAGSYGDAQGLSELACSGPCSPGYYCPAGSIISTQIECGGPEFYCPGRNSSPLRVSDGFYTSVYGSEVCQEGKYRDMTTTAAFTEHLLGVSPIAVNYGDFLYQYALCKTCPAGTWKAGVGDDPSLCIPCPSLITTSSTDGRTCECFRHSGGPDYNETTHYLHFDGTECIALPHTYRGMDRPNAIVSTRFTRTRQYECEPGYYCIDGIRYRCPAGYYGYAPRLTSAWCSGKCDSGYYCPLASTSRTQLQCGAINVYCPSGSPVPIPVHPGHYTGRVALTTGFQDYNYTIRDRQFLCEKGHFCINGKRFKCPAGRYGAYDGETSPYCTGSCYRGYKCPPGSKSPTELECGSPGVVCRSGCHIPQTVTEGYYTLGSSNRTKFYEVPCEKGYFCTGGIKYNCPEGRYGDKKGLALASCSSSCASGYRCPSFPPSTTMNELPCGDNSVYCPGGTGARPIPVSLGYYTVGGSDETTRNNQAQCEPGHYCVGGERFRCAAGRYGTGYGLSHRDCSGWCEAGYACPTASTNPRQQECSIGTYSYQGSRSCMPCPNYNIGDDDEHFSRTCRTSRDCCFAVY